MAQQREHLAKEIDYYKKTNKSSKNLLKKGFKKLKGKIQVSQKTQTYTLIHEAKPVILISSFILKPGLLYPFIDAHECIWQQYIMFDSLLLSTGS